jgi:hypothetical protein
VRVSHLLLGATALLGGCGTLLGIDGDYFEATDAGARVDGSDLDAQAGVFVRSRPEPPGARPGGPGGLPADRLLD